MSKISKDNHTSSMPVFIGILSGTTTSTIAAIYNYNADASLISLGLTSLGLGTVVGLAAYSIGRVLDTEGGHLLAMLAAIMSFFGAITAIVPALIFPDGPSVLFNFLTAFAISCLAVALSLPGNEAREKHLKKRQSEMSHPRGAPSGMGCNR